MSHNDTIVAQATPPGRGGVGILRISGAKAREVAQAVLGKLPKARYADYLPFQDADGTVWVDPKKCLSCKVCVNACPYGMRDASHLENRMHRFVRKCMMLLPVASLGALIFPLALTDFGPQWYAGLVGVTTAFLTSLLKGPMILAIVIALVSTTLMLLI